MTPLCRLLIVAANFAGQLAGLLGLAHPSRREVRAVYGPGVKGGAGQVARQIAAGRVMRYAYEFINRRLDKGGLVPLTSWENERHLTELIQSGKPAILYFHHLNGVRAQSAALHKLGARLLIVVRGTRHQALPGVKYLSVSKKGPTADGARALRAAQEHLRSGGMVLIATEGAVGAETLTASCFGRRIKLRKGLPVLARLMPAPVIPIWSLANGRCGRPHFIAGEPLPTGTFPREGREFDQALADEAARRLEAFLRDHPGEISWMLFHRLLRAEPAV